MHCVCSVVQTEYIGCNNIYIYTPLSSITLDRSDIDGPDVDTFIFMLDTSNSSCIFWDSLHEANDFIVLYAHAEFIRSLICTEGARMQDCDSNADEVSLHERM